MAHSRARVPTDSPAIASAAIAYRAGAGNTRTYIDNSILRFEFIPDTNSAAAAGATATAAATPASAPAPASTSSSNDIKSGGSSISSSGRPASRGAASVATSPPPSSAAEAAPRHTGDIKQSNAAKPVPAKVRSPLVPHTKVRTRMERSPAGAIVMSVAPPAVPVSAPVLRSKLDAPSTVDLTDTESVPENLVRAPAPAPAPATAPVPVPVPVPVPAEATARSSPARIPEGHYNEAGYWADANGLYYDADGNPHVFDESNGDGGSYRLASPHEVQYATELLATARDASTGTSPLEALVPTAVPPVPSAARTPHAASNSAANTAHTNPLPAPAAAPALTAAAVTGPSDGAAGSGSTPVNATPLLSLPPTPPVLLISNASPAAKAAYDLEWAEYNTAINAWAQKYLHLIGPQQPEFLHRNGRMVAGGGGALFPSAAPAPPPQPQPPQSLQPNPRVPSMRDRAPPLAESHIFSIPQPIQYPVMSQPPTHLPSQPPANPAPLQYPYIYNPAPPPPPPPQPLLPHLPPQQSRQYAYSTQPQQQFMPNPHSYSQPQSSYFQPNWHQQQPVPAPVHAPAFFRPQPIPVQQPVGLSQISYPLYVQPQFVSVSQPQAPYPHPHPQPYAQWQPTGVAQPKAKAIPKAMKPTPSAAATVLGRPVATAATSQPSTGQHLSCQRVDAQPPHPQPQPQSSVRVSSGAAAVSPAVEIAPTPAPASPAQVLPATGVSDSSAATETTSLPTTSGDAAVTAEAEEAVLSPEQVAGLLSGGDIFIPDDPPA